MKKRLISSLGVILTLVIVMSLFASCGKSTVKSKFYSEFSLRESAKFISSQEKEIKHNLKGADGDYIDIVFDSAQTVDTVVLYEKNDKITEFEIFAKQNGEFKSIYKQDKVGEVRYCAFANTRTDAVRIKVNSTKGGKFNLTDIDVLNVKHSRDDFRIMSYVMADRIYKEESAKPEYFEIITDITLFGAAEFDENGDISLKNYEIDGQSISGSDVLKKDIENIKAAAGDNAVKIFVNILGPSDDDSKIKEQMHTDVFNNKSDTLISQIKDLLNDLSVDGVYFDYEYPYTKKGRKAYSDFLVKLDAALGETYKLGAALGPWGGKLTDEAAKAIDYIEVMAYDMFDDDGCHATFASNGGVMSLDFMENAGYDIKKCGLGVPFYARPVNKDALWLSYESAYEKLGKFSNIDSSAIDVEDKKDYNISRYFNSYQMVMDKTAFSYDYGAGGMMVWHYSCDADMDTGLSLFAAMADGIKSRQS